LVFKGEGSVERIYMKLVIPGNRIQVIFKTLNVLFIVCSSLMISPISLAHTITYFPGGNCKDINTDMKASCFRAASCTLGDGGAAFVYILISSRLKCPNLNPTVVNEARIDGRVGGGGISGNASGITVNGTIIGIASAWSNCDGNSGRTTRVDLNKCNGECNPKISSMSSFNQFASVDRECTVGDGEGEMEANAWNSIEVEDPCTDEDGDGYKTEDSDPLLCSYPRDCDDSDPDAFPGNETCSQSTEDSDCDGESDWREMEGCGRCGCGSPILLDLKGDGIRLTNASRGVFFNLRNEEKSRKIAWTRRGTDDAWLFLDRNGNRIVDSGAELFGNMTRQSPNSDRHGFLALAEYDKPEWEGNGDSWITKEDAVYLNLRLWADVNHNGMSELEELQSLPEAGISGISLKYRSSERIDRHGNRFKFRASVRSIDGARVGRWAWDVFLTDSIISGR
jgi:hypothetical protein